MRHQVMSSTIHLTFEGYWREEDIACFPARSGVYCVHTGTHNLHENAISVHKLVYIGESANARQRILSHEMRASWRRLLHHGQQLCFSFAPILQGRKQAEAALIFYHKPSDNTEHKHSFPFPTTTLHLSGRVAPLEPFCRVYSTLVTERLMW